MSTSLSNQVVIFCVSSKTMTVQDIQRYNGVLKIILFRSQDILNFKSIVCNSCAEYEINDKLLLNSKTFINAGQVLNNIS